jgi:peptidylprolyl isomerase
MRRPLAAALAAALVLLTAACGDDSQGSELDGVTVSGDFGEEPKIETTDAFTVDEATSAEVVVGDGDKLADTTVINARIAVFDSDGKLVQGNYEAEASERIDLAEGQAPWLAELVGAHIGSRVAVALPVTDVAGPQGAPQAGLEPEESMLFVVDVLGEAPAAQDPPAGAPAVVGDSQGITSLDFTDAASSPPSDFQAATLIEGDGPKVEEGQTVAVNYFASVWGKGDEPFDNTYAKGQPAQFPLEKGNLIDGWVKGLVGVSVGSRVMLIIPPELGYGAKGAGPGIPGGATLVFVIDVLAAQ